MMRLKRRGLVAGYIQVTEYTNSGLLHKHVVLRGKYIDQHVLSLMWNQIHGAKVVDIRRIRSKDPHRNIAGEMAKYLAKENTLRYSWSWGWVWRGFARDWAKLKGRINELTELGFMSGFLDLLKYWHILLKYGRYVDPMTFYNRCFELVQTSGIR